MAGYKRADIVIVGCGFAGAATAYHLSQDYPGTVLVVEKEEIPGFHASGRNASLVMQATLPPQVRHLTVASRRKFETLKTEIGFTQSGSLLLGARSDLENFVDTEILDSRFLSSEEVQSRISTLRNHVFEAALWTPSDGVMDIARLLDFYIAGARSQGVEFQLKTEIRDVEYDGSFRLETSQGSLECSTLVNAAGAWAPLLAKMAGASDLPLCPMKRHLFVLDEMEGLDPGWPFVWDVANNFYFRPESGGLLFSICDEELAVSLEPTVNSEIAERLADLIWRFLPALKEAVQRRVWSCFRTKTPDDLFVLGADPALENFFWTAGLGGHGVGASWEAGRLASELILGNASEDSQAFAPSRFLDGAGKIQPSAGNPSQKDLQNP